MPLTYIHAVKPITSVEEAIQHLQALEEDCKFYGKESRRFSYEDIHRRFEQGRIVSEVLAMPHEDKYGKGLLAHLASKIDLHEQTLRDAHAVFKRAGSKTVFIEQWAQWEEEGRSITWSMVKNWGRKGLPDDADKAADQVEKELGLLEKATRSLERRCKDLAEKAVTYTDSEKEAVLGVLLRAGGAIVEVKETQISLPKPTRERNELYLRYIRGKNCLTCAKSETIAHHLDRGGLSTKGSDLLTVPLCSGCHQVLHDDSERLFWEKASLNPWRYVSDYLTQWYALSSPFTNNGEQKMNKATKEEKLHMQVHDLKAKIRMLEDQTELVITDKRLRLLAKAFKAEGKDYPRAYEFWKLYGQLHRE